MGSGDEEDEEDEEDEGLEEEELLIINQCLMPNAPCPIPILSSILILVLSYFSLLSPHSPLPIPLLLQTC